MANPSATASTFGQQLRLRRHRAGVSQIDLAADAGTTPRHVSFIETGRSRPGRDLVLRLAEALNMPLRERNSLLVAAGLTPSYPAFDLGDEAMGPIRLVLERALECHEPYPAWVAGPGLTFLAANRAADRLFPGLTHMPAAAIVDFWFGPGPFRQIVENWQDVVWAGVVSLRREALRGSSPEQETLLKRAEFLARDIPPPEPGALTDWLVVCPRLVIDGCVVRTISAVMRFDTAIEVTTSELRVELMFPADPASDAFFKRRAAG